MNNKTLRLIAFVGTLFFALKYIFFIEEFEYNQSYNYYILIFTVLGVAFALFIFQKSTAKLFSNPDLLVPVGLFITVTKTLEMLFSNASTSLTFENSVFNYTSISITVISGFLIYLLCSTIFAGWQTLLILQLVKDKKFDLIVSLKNIKNWLPRTFVAILFGWSIVIIIIFALFGVISLNTNITSSVWFIYTYLFIIPILSLAWNLATALVLPNILQSNKKIVVSIIESINLSLKNGIKLAIPVVLQMVIIGWIIFFSVSYYQKAEFGDSRSGRTVTTNYETNFIWTGGYNYESKWNKKLLKTVKSETHETVDFKLMLLLLLLAIVIKIQIINIIWGKDSDTFNFSDNIDYNKQFIMYALAMLAIYMLPFERLVTEIKVSELLNSDALLSETAVENNPYLEKELMFEIPKDGKIKIVGEEGLLDIKFFFIEDIAVGELDREKGQDTFILSNDSVLILNEKEEVKKIVYFKFDSPKYEDGSSPSYSEGKIIDVDNDGICEFLMFEGSLALGKLPTAIFNQDGERIWYSYLNKESDEDESLEGSEKPKIELVVSGKTKEDSLERLFLLNDKGIEPFDIERFEDKKFVYSDNYIVFQEQVSEELLAVVKSGRAIIKNTVDEPLKKPKKPFLSKNYIFDSKNYPLTIHFENEQLGLFNFDGKLVSKYAAPNSEVEYGLFEQHKAMYRGDTKVTVFQSMGKEFKHEDIGETYSAFIANQSHNIYGFTAMLYIYDDNGKLLLNESFEEVSSINMFVVKNVGESESLLIENKDKIWRYYKK